MLRDGRDVVYSHELRYKSDPGLAKHWGNDVIKYGAMVWRNSFRCSSKFFGHPRVRVVRYEDLVATPAEVMASVFEFLGEPATPEAVQAYSSTDDQGWGNMALRREQTSKALFDGRGKWKKWTCEERQNVESGQPEFVALLHSLGYAGLECEGLLASV